MLGDTKAVLRGYRGCAGSSTGSSVHARVHAMSVRACACAHVCVSVHLDACARARVRPCVYACLCERVWHVCGFVRFHQRNAARVCAPRRCARPAIARRRLAVFIARPAPRVAAARARLRSVRPAVSGARSAAGVTWTSRTANAPWAGRFGHTSVVDAVSGVIYVIGGYSYSGDFTFYNDVWLSTDGGARARLGRGRDRGVHSVGYSSGVLDWGTRLGYEGVLRSTKG